MQIRSRPSLSDSCSLPVGQETSLLWLAGLELVCLRLIPHLSPLLCAVGRDWEDALLILQRPSARSRWAEPAAESASSPHSVT